MVTQTPTADCEKESCDKKIKQNNVNTLGIKKIYYGSSKMPEVFQTLSPYGKSCFSPLKASRRRLCRDLRAQRSDHSRNLPGHGGQKLSCPPLSPQKDALPTDYQRDNRTEPGLSFSFPLSISSSLCGVGIFVPPRTWPNSPGIPFNDPPPVRYHRQKHPCLFFVHIPGLCRAFQGWSCLRISSVMPHPSALKNETVAQYIADLGYLVGVV